MFVESFMTVKLFYYCRKTFLTTEQTTGVTVLKQLRYAVFDSAFIKLPLLIYSTYKTLIIKTSNYEHMRLLRMQVQNQ